MMRLDAEWYDFRDLGNLVGSLQEQFEDWGAPDWVPYVTGGVIGVLAILLWTILSVLAFIWIERRVVGLMQNRIGPNRVGPTGLLQPVADALKLLFKEPVTTRSADRVLFWLAPIVIFIPTIVVFAVIPFGEQMVLADLNVGVLFLIAIGSINTIAVFMAGWASNNKYALIGAMRTIAMLISYELIQVLVLLAAVLFVGSMRLGDIVAWQTDYGVWLLFLQPLGLLGYVIAGAVEMNRSPTDIAEAESEIVAGYHTEYGGIKFGFFYQAEYLAGFAIAAVIVTLYMGGWTLWGIEEWVPGWLIFLAKLYGVFFIYIWSRGTLPRLRIDQLMAFAWKMLIPMALISIAITALEVLVWREFELGDWVLYVFVAVNVLLAAVLLASFFRMITRGYYRLPRRVRLVHDIAVPSLPASEGLAGS
jgi:NADH-quinone oxidoreductase subunit H